MVGCFRFNGPLRQYFSLYRAVGAVWYKVLVTAFIFEHVVSVTSLFGYQTKKKVAARSGERNKKLCFFYKYCKIF